MRKLVRNAVIIAIAAIIAAFAVTPPSEKLRLGKDLAGGFNVVYYVDTRTSPDPGETLDKVIQVVKKRLDPTGMMEIQVVGQGKDRIEITMPLPRPEVKQLQLAFEDELAKLTTGSLEPDELDAIMRLPAEERTKHLRGVLGEAPGRTLSQVNEARLVVFEEAAAAYDAVQRAREPYENQKAALAEARARLAPAEADPDGVGGESVVDLMRAGVLADERAVRDRGRALALAEIDYEAARSKALSSLMTTADIRRALRLRNDPVRLRDDAQNAYVEWPAPRAEAIKRLKDAYPASAAQIDRLLEAWSNYEQKATTISGPADLVRLLQGAGVLTFRIAVSPNEIAPEQELPLRQELRERGPVAAGTDQFRWFKINKMDGWFKSVQQARSLAENAANFFNDTGYVGAEYDGEYYLLAWDTPDRRLTQQEGAWELAGARPDQDRFGRAAIAFQMDARGSTKMGNLTEKNVGRPMAILLDDEIYTAPTIQQPIFANGQITGEFSRKEIDYIVQVLSAGSLQAKLGKQPISTNLVAPELGADNLSKGLRAGLIAFLVCAGFMIVYYFACGVISVVALLLNALLIVGAMALNEAAFTMPGIAGVILTFGMAVDANVLIYERLREELKNGHDFKTAVRLGYQKALSSIVDGNVTTLIVCVVLGTFGTQEIKGFAITLGIGLVMTLFTQLFATRQLFAWAVEHARFWRRTSMLPIAIPALDRALSPSIDWMRLRWAFASISILLTGLSIAGVATLGSSLLDSEFRGGTKVAFELRETEPGSRLTLTRAEVQERIRSAKVRDPELQQVVSQLGAAEVTVVNPLPGNRSSEFWIKTTLTDTRAVQSAVIAALADAVDAQAAISFQGARGESLAEAPIFPVTEPVLGASIGRPDVTADVSNFVGGVAIVLDAISSEQPVRLAALETRLRQMRDQPDFQDASTRDSRIVILEGSAADVRSAAVLVRDPKIDFREDVQSWQTQLRAREWTLTRAALTESSSLKSVDSFSPQIAQTFRAQAILAILFSTVLVVIYVWVRFGSFRYSAAAITTTLHDCIVAVGAIALANYLVLWAPGLADSLGIKPFKFDLSLVAAVLTILGYSLNDTIIVMDRIREHRGKLAHANRHMINSAINRTVSRTVITSGTTLTAIFVLYLFGGEAVREFSYAMLIGVLIGTYSSIAVAAPLVWAEEHERPVLRRAHGEFAEPEKALTPA